MVEQYDYYCESCGWEGNFPTDNNFCPVCGDDVMESVDDSYEDDGQPDDYTEQHDFAHDGFEDEIGASDMY